MVSSRPQPSNHHQNCAVGGGIDVDAWGQSTCVTRLLLGSVVFPSTVHGHHMPSRCPLQVYVCYYNSGPTCVFFT